MQFDSPARSILTRAMREHLARLIDAQRVGDPRPEQLEHAAGAGADIEQIARRERADDIGEHRLDFGLVDIERADAVPVRRIVAEIRGGQFRALALDRRQPLQIERDRLVLLAARIHQIAAQRADRLCPSRAGKTPNSPREHGRAARRRTEASDGARRAVGFAQGFAPIR